MNKVKKQEGMIMVGVKDIKQVLVKSHDFYRRNGAIWTDPDIHTPIERRKYFERPELDLQYKATTTKKILEDKKQQQEEKIERMIIHRDLTRQTTLDRQFERIKLEVTSGLRPSSDLQIFAATVVPQKAQLISNLKVNLSSSSVSRATSRPVSAVSAYAVPMYVAKSSFKRPQSSKSRQFTGDDLIQEDYSNLTDFDTPYPSVAELNPNIMSVSLDLATNQVPKKCRDYFSNGSTVLENPLLTAPDRLKYILNPEKDAVAIKRIDEKFYEEEKIREVEESSKRQIHNQLRRSFIQQYEVNRERPYSAISRTDTHPPKRTEAVPDRINQLCYERKSTLKAPYVSKDHVDYRGLTATLLREEDTSRNSIMESATPNKDVSANERKKYMHDEFNINDIKELNDFESRLQTFYSG